MTNMDANRFSQVLRKFRVLRGLSQEEVALQAGLHRTYVSQLERNVKSPSLRTAMILARVLGVPFSEFAQALESEDV
jgi:transcriptional regulator with XRE-family HTH domain